MTCALVIASHRIDTMADDELLWTYHPPRPAKPRPGEPVFTLTKAHRRIVCELHYHGEFGVEALFLREREGSSVATLIRAVAVRWGELKRADLEQQGWR